MSHVCRNRITRRAAFAVAQLLAAVLVCCVPMAHAQRLPFQRYNVDDGLAHSRVTSIHQDRKGYLWFGTWEGLSRFDGYRFTNYGLHDGLDNFVINTIAEDRQGHLWVGTNGGGVARLVDDPQETLATGASGSNQTTRKRFVSYRIGDSRESNHVSALLFDADNTLWCATDAGLYRATANQSSHLKFEMVLPSMASEWYLQAFADSRGRLWFVTKTELIQIAQGQIKRCAPPIELPHLGLGLIREDHQGNFLVTASDQVFQFVTPTDASGCGLWKRLPLDLTPRRWIFAMLIDSKGVLWIGTLEGLIKYADGHQTRYTTAQGLSDNSVSSLDEDSEGNLWIGTNTGGVCKLSGQAIVSYTRAEGLPSDNIGKVIEGRDGRIYAITDGIVEIVNGKAVVIPGSQVPLFRNVNRRILQDSRGDWWLGTEEGLFRFNGPELQFRHRQKFTQKDGISEKPIYLGPGLYEDCAGRIWISSADDNLYWFDRARKERPLFQHISLGSPAPLDMFSDQSGALWLARYGALGRLVNGEYIPIQPTEGLPETEPRAFFQDSRGWLWIGLRNRGLSMTTDPTAEPLKFVNYSTENGLSSNTVRCVTEDNMGRIYFGTGRGLNQLDLTTGRVRHFSTADGLAGHEIWHCLKDRQGNIWVATVNGLSKFDPRAKPKSNHLPPIYLSRVQVAGEDLPLPETGAANIPELTLPPSSNNLFIEYVGLSFQGGQTLKYQYKLEGIDADWNAPTIERSVNYARLPPGSYQFAVRVINQDGLMSREPAVFQFRILPPVWQRWWFVGLIALLAGVTIYSLYHLRVNRLLALERVRTRIATDLHDDIGSNLSRIAMLSEVVRRQVGEVEPKIAERLSLVAGISREMVDSMSDIVWAVDPQRDHLSDLVQRMRRYAGDTFGARNIEFDFIAPPTDQDIKLGADVRREVYLIFKEAVSNIIRHSGCTEARIDFRIEGETAVLKFSDNGRGFDPSSVNSGNGLESMKRRAKAWGGEFDINSQPGAGTTIMLKIPLSR